MIQHENLKGRVAVVTGGGGVLCSAFAKNVQRAPEGGRKKAAAAGRLFHLIEMIYLFLCFSEGGRR